LVAWNPQVAPILLDPGPMAPTVCAHCGKPGSLIPIGFVSNSVWLHSECHPTWHAKRRAAAIAAYARVGIHPPGTRRMCEAAE
jgi:hypothetical protein